MIKQKDIHEEPLFEASVERFTLTARRPLRTSRGEFTQRETYLLRLLSRVDNKISFGIGECSRIPNLSLDDRPGYEKRLEKVCQEFRQTGTVDLDDLRKWPSILFGVESALEMIRAGGRFDFFPTPFSEGTKGVPINGLIWMDTIENMRKQVREKINEGFRCLKMKLSERDFEEELTLIKEIRQTFNPDEIAIRVDANGSFNPDTALDKLKRLADLGVESIEQPIAPNQWKQMAQLVMDSPLPIALDEELIPCVYLEQKIMILTLINPDYIVLKPSLHGGMHGCMEWIFLADDLGVDWWITSALESNIGLNAIAQFAAALDTQDMPQGLGTGELYVNNFDSPIYRRQDKLFSNPHFEKNGNR